LQATYKGAHKLFKIGGLFKDLFKGETSTSKVYLVIIQRGNLKEVLGCHNAHDTLILHQVSYPHEILTHQSSQMPNVFSRKGDMPIPKNYD
jgi:hypothetical protein